MPWMQKKNLYVGTVVAVVLFFVICVVVLENGKLSTENGLKMFTSLLNAQIVMAGGNLSALFV